MALVQPKKEIFSKGQNLSLMTSFAKQYISFFLSPMKIIICAPDRLITNRWFVFQKERGDAVLPETIYFCWILTAI